MKHWTYAPLVLLTLMFSAPVLADSDRQRLKAPDMPLYRQECASCHTAYPPGMLPAASWRRVTGSLDKHYGSDAAVDAATLDSLNRYLLAHAASSGSKYGREQPPEDRITRAAWFKREHDELRADVWKRASIKSAANCAACHPGADKGDFNEHAVRIPR